MVKALLKVYVLALLVKLCNFFFTVSAFSMGIVVATIFRTTCNASYLVTYYLAESPVKNLTRTQLL